MNVSVVVDFPVVQKKEQNSSSEGFIASVWIHHHVVGLGENQKKGGLFRLGAKLHSSSFGLSIASYDRGEAQKAIIH